jgi:hypothetical protein
MILSAPLVFVVYAFDLIVSLILLPTDQVQIIPPSMRVRQARLSSKKTRREVVFRPVMSSANEQPEDPVPQDSVHKPLPPPPTSDLPSSTSQATSTSLSLPKTPPKSRSKTTPDFPNTPRERELPRSPHGFGFDASVHASDSYSKTKLPWEVRGLFGLALGLLSLLIIAAILHLNQSQTSASSHIDPDHHHHLHEPVFSIPTFALFETPVEGKLHINGTPEEDFLDNGDKGHKAWFHLLPAGHAQVKVVHPSRLGLPKSDSWSAPGHDEGRSDAEIYDVSVVRDLECLMMLREVLNRFAGKGDRLEQFTNEELGIVTRSCMDHCTCHYPLLCET